MNSNKILYGIAGTLAAISLYSCKPQAPESAAIGDAASRVYVAPGKHDEFYSFLSGGFSGQVAVYGLPSGRLLKVIPVFSQNPENGYGYNENTKPMLNTSFGFVPWDDLHHPKLSREGGMTNGEALRVRAAMKPISTVPRALATVDMESGASAPLGSASSAGSRRCPSA